ncbi:hypothetical protein [Leekyejoonella antrihumi]|uniref:Heparin-binding hemagglutinin n=1 Tax=Leekyejoonella antrihumi TaxID=1660198 RepID=A0A563E988_9MICO|nr:hypothetical protein [Leekyejoonella antrihumi]TWP38889.1 hypothetical protein FGL98_00320 [Leekyejoonella antrihumi]
MAMDIKKTLTDATPFYALVGAADQVVTDVKGALGQAQARTLALRGELEPKSLQTKVTGTVAEVRTRVEALPGTATARFDAVTDGVEKTYTDFANRGQKVVTDLRNRPEVKSVSERADQLVGQGKDAVGTARKVMDDTQTTVRSTVYAGRKQAAQEIADVAGKVESDAKTAARSNAAKEGLTKKESDAKPAAKKTTAKKAPAKKTTAKKTSSSKA